MYSPEILSKTIKLMNRLLVIDQQAQSKKPNDFFKSLVQKNSHQILLQLSDDHPNHLVKQTAMEHLALITSMPDIFIHINIDEFCKKLIQRAFFTAPSATSSGEINCQAYALQCLNNLACSDQVLFEEILLG
mmetsp:Transcript_1831/g.2459  ORF Transcript_1831/g.2459 Transcript_1831/m.2459 type:complete len:132 (+) Transcript_1831:314-709(+)